VAAPSYTTDLTDISTIESGDSFFEFSGYSLGDGADVESDWYIQGSACASDEANNKTGVGHSIGYDYGSTITFSTDDCFFAWMYCLMPNAPDTFANGGYRVLIGSSTSNFDGWKVGGSDFGRNPYGGWVNVAVDPTYTPDYTSGTSTGYRYFGIAYKLVNSTLKGRPICADAYRYGRGEVKIEHGDGTNGYGTFVGVASANDAQTARWGLFQKESGSYLWKGLLSFGNSTNACDFRDSNRVIVIDDTPRTYTSFNKIEINNSSSRVDWDAITFLAVNPSQLSRGIVSVVDNADFNITGCSFTSMNTFTFQTNTSCLGSTFRGCNLITAAGADMTGSRILKSTVSADSSALNWNVNTDPDGYLDNMTFEMGSNSHHAIEFGTSSPTSMTLRGVTSTGFSASNSQNDSFFYVARTSGTVTINLVGCTGNFTYKSAGATVSIVQDPVTTKITVKALDGGSIIENARVLVWVTDDSNFPYQDSVTITGSGTTATVTHTGHGLVTNDNVIIKGANQDVYNGAYEITVTDANTYTYTTSERIGTTPATGTITSTFAVISGLTDSNGEISDTRTYTTDQAISGWVRKSTASPYYKQGPISGTIDSSAGFSVTIQLVSDE